MLHPSYPYLPYYRRAHALGARGQSHPALLLKFQVEGKQDVAKRHNINLRKQDAAGGKMQVFILAKGRSVALPASLPPPIQIFL
jgi:hypothetical protein